MLSSLLVTKFCVEFLLSHPLLAFHFLLLVVAQLVNVRHLLGLHLVIELPDLRDRPAIASRLRRMLSVPILSVGARAISVRVESRLRVAHFISR